MLLLKRCCTSSGKKKKGKKGVSFQYPYFKRDLGKFMRIEKKAARTIQNHGKAWQTERLGTQQDRQSLPHSSCCWRKGPSLTHTPSSQRKRVFCWISYPSAPSSRSAEGRRSLQGISATHRFNSLLENAQWGWEMESREILDWIQGHVLNRELCNH